MSVAAKRLAGRVARAAMAGFGFVLSAMPVAGAQTPFYRASEPEIAGPPGSLIRQEPMFGAPDGAAAYRVLYRSTNPEGGPIAVSASSLSRRSPRAERRSAPMTY